MKTVSIIGSFRKENHYAKIVETIERLRENNIEVLSPAGTEVVGSINKFVIFNSDNPNLTPAQIEEETIKKIFASDIVYVCNVDGYIGNTTQYEIGRCEVRGKEMYFFEPPEDLMMDPSKIKVMSVDDLILYIKGNDKSKR